MHWKRIRHDAIDLAENHELHLKLTAIFWINRMGFRGALIPEFSGCNLEFAGCTDSVFGAQSILTPSVFSVTSCEASQCAFF